MKTAKKSFQHTFVSLFLEDRLSNSRRGTTQLSVWKKFIASRRAVTVVRNIRGSRGREVADT